MLGDAVNGGSIIALAASFAWGVLSVVLSPCHLSSIPLIVGFISGQGKMTPRRAFGLSAMFAFGILVTIAVIGLITGALGRMLGDLGPYGNYIVAGVFVLVGLNLLGAIQMPWSGPTGVKMRRRGYIAAMLLGLIFGLAVGPCTFAYMAPVLSVTFGLAAKRLVFAMSLLFTYGLGHCSVIAVAGGCTGIVQRYLNWNDQSRAVSVVKKVCGLLILLAGGYLIWSARRPS